MNEKVLIARMNLTNNILKKNIKEPRQNQFKKELNIFHIHTKHYHGTMSILCSICC